MSDLSFVPRAEFVRVRGLNAPAPERVALFATLARINTLSMIAAAGSGHIGSSFSSLDIVTWLFLQEMKLPARPDRREERDIFFSSKGHDAPGLYAVMVGMGLLPEATLMQLRRLGGLPGHPDVTLTPYIEANTGSLGMGISKAKGMAIANRLSGRKTRLFVMTGDGELQEGQIWESLGSAVRRELSEITVIVDHNKVQSDLLVSETADLGDLQAKFAAFGWNVLRCDGHDVVAFGAAVAAARAERSLPTVIIADTIKGRGVSFMEHTAKKGRLYRYHSGAPSADDYEHAIDELTERAWAMCDAMGCARPVIVHQPKPESSAASGPTQRLVKAYGEALLEEAAATPEIVALDADLVLDTGLIPFSERYPERFIECGIAEMDMVSQASGLALSGFLPIVHSFSCFLTPRANEQIYNADSEGNRIIYVGSLAGVLPAGPGHSHQSVRDIALMGCLPGTTPVEPCCESETAMAVRWAVRENPRSTYLRLVSIPVVIPFKLPPEYQLQKGRGVRLTNGDDVAIFSYGPVVLSQAWWAAQRAKGEGLGLRVINIPWLTHFDRDWLTDAVTGCRAVLCLDNHFVSGGQGEKIAAALATAGVSLPVHLHGLTEIPACGGNDEVLKRHALDADGILSIARGLLQRNA